VSGVATLPRWQCASCPSWTYSAGRPDGWKWATGGLICPGCQLDRLHGRKPPEAPGASTRADPSCSAGEGAPCLPGMRGRVRGWADREVPLRELPQASPVSEASDHTYMPGLRCDLPARALEESVLHHDVSQPRPMGAAEGAEPMTTKRWCAYCGSRLADEVDDPLQVVDIACPDCQAKGLSRRVVRSRPDRSARQDPRRRANTRRRRKR
jgi:hypothetical protein